MGAAVTALRVPDAKGENPVDVVLGFDTAEDYLSAKNPYFGATVGRVANRKEPILASSVDFSGFTVEVDRYFKLVSLIHLTMLKIH